MQNEFFDIVEDNKFSYGKITSYKDLVVWQRSIELVKQIYFITGSMPDAEKFGLTSQIRRAAISVSSNIAEGWGLSVTGNYLHHLKISFGSLCEVETQLIIIEELNLIDKNELKNVKETLLETSKMLKGLIISLEKQIKN
jgi:four helix bundle protein